jgi:SNF2 family DNA or RNA helicase
MNYPTASIHGELTADGRRIILLAVGHDTAVAWAARRLRHATPLIKPTDPPGALTLPATWAAAVQLTGLFGPWWAPGPRLREWARQELERRSGNGRLTYHPPAGLVPRPYQETAAAMIAATGRVLIFDEPGTGKTITTILGLAERDFAHDTFPVVCVVPASVVDPWVDAWRAWAPDWTAVAWRGAPEQRRALFGTADVYVVGYDTARIDVDLLARLGPVTVVADEVHMIKTPTAKRSLATRRLARKAEVFVGLSGTPITHHPGDLWPTLEALEPLAWPSRERWVKRYCDVIDDEDDYGEQVIGLAPDTETELRTALIGQHRRVAKADVLDQLPPKVYSIRMVELPGAYRKAYDDMAHKMLAQMPDSGEHLSAMTVLAQLTRLAQLASAAADIEITTEIDDDGQEVEHVHVRLRAPSWKVDALLEIIDERPGQPVVAFAPSRQLMMLAGQKADLMGLAVGYVVGGQSMGERTTTVERFQAGKLDLLCATTGAGGIGLTLTAARTCVFLQRPWSLVEALQAEDRLHRIGAEGHESIEIIDIVAADTIDTEVRAVLREKAGQLSALVQDPRIVTELLGGKP